MCVCVCLHLILGIVSSIVLENAVKIYLCCTPCCQIIFHFVNDWLEISYSEISSVFVCVSVNGRVHMFECVY